MHLRLLTHVLSCLVCLGCITVSSASEHKPIKASKFKITAKPGAGKSISDMASANFYITSDKGTTWKQISKEQIVHETGKAPYFIFKAPKDGLYGFWIQVIFNDGNQDKAPQPGSTAPFMRLIDTTAPKINGFSAGLITGTAGSTAKIFVEWNIQDLHLSKTPVEIEFSRNGTDWEVFKQGLSASGKDMFALPSETPFSLRLQAKDLAKNQSTSDSIMIGKVASAPAEKTDKKQENNNGQTPSTALPSLDEIDEDVEKELAQQKQVAAKKKQQQIEERPVVPPDHQDIIAPYANKPWPKKEELEASADPQMDEPKDDASINRGPKIIDSDIALILERRKGRILFGKDAERILAAARQAVMDGNNERAEVLYARLKDSTVASEALPEEIELHLRLNNLDIARELVRTAPPEVRNTKMRIQQASLYLIDGKRKLAISLLTGLIPDETDDYRNAQLLLARSYIEDNKTNSALSILRPMAQRQDSWGQAAQALLDQINN